MGLSRYHYNPQTCRYEPSRTSIGQVTWAAVLFCISTALIFWGILFLHGRFFLSEEGKALKKENTAFKKHHASIRAELVKVQGMLTSLNEQNSTLHKKLFETALPKTGTTAPTNERILLADASDFKAAVSELNDTYLAVSKRSDIHTFQFTSVEVNDQDIAFLMSIPSIQPVKNSELTRLVSGFGKRIHPFHKGNYHHSGIDFAATRGTSVMATADGRVVDIRNGSTLQAGYGNYVEIDHGNGLVTRYAHLEDVSVRFGQKVSKGSVIGTVGMSGGAIAPHVHYEIIRNGKQVDPLPYLLEGISSKDYSELQRLGRKKNQSLD